MEGEKFSLAPASDENGGVWMGDSYAPIIFSKPRNPGGGGIPPALPESIRNCIIATIPETRERPWRSK
jgi:hypothetical protein